MPVKAKKTKPAIEPAYQVKHEESGVFHVEQEQVRFDPATGERLSRARICKYESRVWLNSIKKNMGNLGYTYTVLHDPTK